MQRLLFIHLLILASFFSIESLAQNSPLFKTLKSGDVCYTIGDKYAGEFILGDEIPEQKYLEHFQVRKAINHNEECYMISENDKDVIELIPQLVQSGDKTIEIIKEIRVIADKFKTPRGITVNAEIEDLLSAYPSCRIHYSRNENMIILESDETDAKFLISKSDFKGEINSNSPMAKLDISHFKPHTKIVEVRLL